MSQFFASGGQSIGVSASASVLPMNIQDNKLWTILKEVGIPDHLTCLLRNLYAGQEATVRTRSNSWKNGLVQNWERSTTGCINISHAYHVKHFTCISCEMLGWKNYKLESRLLDIQGLWFWGEVWSGVLIMRLVNIKTVFTAKSLNEIIKKVSTDRKQKTSKN